MIFDKNKDMIVSYTIPPHKNLKHERRMFKNIFDD